MLTQALDHTAMPTTRSTYEIADLGPVLEEAIKSQGMTMREADLRTEEPLPADYEGFRNEVHGEASDDEIRRFEEEWADLYSETS